jgi:hypothetical protein
MRERKDIETEIAKATNEVGCVDICVARRVTLELLLDIREQTIPHQLTRIASSPRPVERREGGE